MTKRMETRIVARTAARSQRANRRPAPTIAAARALWQGIVQLSAPSRVVILILIVAAALRFAALAGPSTEYDEGVYWQSLRAMAQGHALFSSVFSSQPPFFLLSLYPFYALLGQSIFAARLGVAIYSLIGLVAIYLAGRAIAGGWGGVIACALLAVDPLYLKESTTLQAEAPSLVFAIIAVALAAFSMRLTPPIGRWDNWEAALRRYRPRRLTLALLSGVALGLGIMIKLWDVVAIVPIVLYLSAPFFSVFALPGDPPSDGARRVSATVTSLLAERARGITPDLLAFAVGIVLAVVATVAPFVGSLNQLYAQVVQFHLAAGKSAAGGLSYNVGVVLGGASLYLTGLAAALALALAIGRRLARDGQARRVRLAWRMAPPALWALASAILLVRQTPLFPHHITLLAPPLALMAALALPLATGVAPETATAGESLRQGRRRAKQAPRESMAPPTGGLRPSLGMAVVGVMVVITLIGLLRGIGADQMASQPQPALTQTIVVALQAFTAPNDLIVSDDEYVVALANRSVPPQLVDTSQVRISSGYLTTAQIEGIILTDDVRFVLFASGRFQLAPNFAAWVRANFRQVASFGKGKALYLRQPPGPVLA